MRPGRTRRHRDDRGAGHERHPTLSPALPANVSDRAAREPALDEAYGRCNAPRQRRGRAPRAGRSESGGPDTLSERCARTAPPRRDNFARPEVRTGRQLHTRLDNSASSALASIQFAASTFSVNQLSRSSVDGVTAGYGANPTRRTRSRNRGSPRRLSRSGSTRRKVMYHERPSYVFSSHENAWS